MSRVIFIFILAICAFQAHTQIDPYIQDSLKRVLPINKGFQDSLSRQSDTTASAVARRGIKQLSIDTNYVSVFIYNAYYTQFTQLQNQLQSDLNFYQKMIADIRQRYKQNLTTLQISILTNPPIVPPR